MQCRDARDLFDSFIGEELLVETNHELLQHLATCPECAAELDGRRRIRSGLKQAFGRSAELRVRPEFAAAVATRLRSSARPNPRPTWRTAWIAIAASAIVATGVGAWLLRARGSDVARLAAGDHQNCAVKFALAEKPISLQEAASRFDAAFAHLETAPPDTVPSAAGMLRVADRHSCVFAGRRFGHVVFTLHAHVVSVLMTADASANQPSENEGTVPLTWLPRQHALAMASFHTRGHLVYIVGDLEEAAFRNVATALAQPVSVSTARNMTFEALLASVVGHVSIVQHFTR